MKVSELTWVTRNSCILNFHLCERIGTNDPRKFRAAFKFGLHVFFCASARQTQNRQHEHLIVGSWVEWTFARKTNFQPLWSKQPSISLQLSTQLYELKIWWGLNSFVYLSMYDVCAVYCIPKISALYWTKKGNFYFILKKKDIRNNFSKCNYLSIGWEVRVSQAYTDSDRQCTLFPWSAHCSCEKSIDLHLLKSAFSPIYETVVRSHYEYGSSCSASLVPHSAT